jgi:hypothetical protein
MTFPFFNRSVKTKKVPHLFLGGEKLFSTRAVKIDEKGALPRNQNILELEVSVKEPSFVKFTKKASSGTDGASFGEELFRRGLRINLPKILNQIYSLGNLQGKKISLVKMRGDQLMDSTNRVDR